MIVIKYAGRDLTIEVNKDTLHGLDLSNQDLHRIILVNYDLPYAKFNQVKDGRNAEFYQSNLSHAEFIDSNFIMGFFREAILYQADFTNAILRQAYFEKADLSKAIFYNADIRRSQFNEANLCGVDMRCKNLDDASFKDAIFDDKTQWAEGFDPIKSGAIRV